VRYSGISIVYQVSGIVSSSITPLVATSLLHYGNLQPWWVALYIACVGLISAVCTYFIRRTF
jgi:MHS family shikimate/dehydroshikimate transporter-like MFS transporter